MTSLFERYRPATWQEVIGQPKAVAALQRIGQKDGFGGQAFWISGKSGQGKSTLAKLIASVHADDLSTEEIDSQWCTPARLRELELGLSIRGWGEKAGRCVIVNEAHRLSNDATGQLLTMLERLPAHVCIVFTTTFEGESLFGESLDASPLLSRCKRIKLQSQGIAKLFAERAREIAQRENLDGKPIGSYMRLVEECKGNMRAVLQSIEAGEMLS